jgi:hypothetical protein
METFSEFENYRRRYLIDYFKKIIISSEKNNLLKVHSYITTPFPFFVFESFSLFFCMMRYLTGPGFKQMSFTNTPKFILVFSSVTLINMNVFLRNCFNEYPFQKADKSLPFEEWVLSGVDEKQIRNSKFECFLQSYTGPGFCIYKDVFLLKFLNVILLPYIVYLNYSNEKKEKQGKI